MPIQEYYAPERPVNEFSRLDNTARVGATLREFYAPNVPGTSTGFQGSEFDTGVDVGTFDSLSGPTGPVVTVAFSPDGTRIAAGSKDTRIRVWHTSKRRRRLDLVGHTAIVEAVAFSPGGSLIVSGSGDRTIRVWHALSGGQSRQVLTGHTAAVRAVAFSEDNKHVISGAEDGTVRIWDLATRSHRVVSGQKPLLAAVAFSREGGVVALSSHGGREPTLKLMDLGDPGLRFLPGIETIAHALAFSPNGKSLMAGMADNTVRSWNLIAGDSRVLIGHLGPVFSVVCSPDGTLLASGSADGTVRIWNSGHDHDHFVISNEAKVWSLAYSPNGKMIAVGLGSGTVRVFGAVLPQSGTGATTALKDSIKKMFKSNSEPDNVH